MAKSTKKEKAVKVKPKKVRTPEQKEARRLRFTKSKLLDPTINKTLWLRLKYEN